MKEGNLPSLNWWVGRANARLQWRFLFQPGLPNSSELTGGFFPAAGRVGLAPFEKEKKEKRKEKRERRENKRREKKGREEGRKALAPHSDVPKAKGLKTPPAWRSFINKFRFRKKVLKH